MEMPDTTVTLGEFKALVDSFLSDECEKGNGHLIHKKCGGGIQKGFANLYYLAEDGTLDPGPDGFGIGPVAVPYCENCDPPNGFNHTYARRIPIAREP